MPNYPDNLNSDGTARINLLTVKHKFNKSNIAFFKLYTNLHQ